MIIMIIAFYLLIIIFELIPLAKTGQKKELWFYSAIIAFTFTISILVGLGINIPSPANPIKKLVFAVLGK